MRRLMEVIASNRVDLTPLVTHRVKLDDIDTLRSFSPTNETAC
jgi:hypothetical protein